MDPAARALRVDAPVDYAGLHPVYATDLCISSVLDKLRRDPEYQLHTFLAAEAPFFRIAPA